MRLSRQNAMQQGFTFLEMGIVLLILAGAVGVFSMSSQQVASPSSCYHETQAQLQTIRTSMDHFVREKGRYPTPSIRNGGLMNSTYGQEATGANIDNFSNGTNPILFGALPFHALGLASSYAVDCWGNQLSYIVTESLTTSVSNHPALPPTGFLNPSAVGGLTIKSGTTASPTAIISNAAYGVISHGESGRRAGNGAVPANNLGPRGWCAGTTPLDRQNCNLTDAILIDGLYRNDAAAGADFFDDLIVYATKAASNCNANSYPVTWRTGPTICNATLAGPIPNTASQMAVSVTTGTVGTATFSCASGTPVVSGAAPSCAPIPVVNGACGAAQGGSFQLLPTLNLCTAGTATLVADTATLFKWSCAGSGGGATQNCTATPVCKCGGITLICTNPRNPFGGINLLGINILC